MSSKLVQRFNEIGRELEAIQRSAVEQTDKASFQRRVATLRVEQDRLQQTMHFIALSHLKDEAWRALAHGMAL